MAIFTVFLWIGIALGCIWGSVYLVTGRKTDDWNAMIAIALAIVFLESLRWWAYFLTESRVVLFWFRVATPPVSMIFLFLFAHFRLGLEDIKQKLWIAALYPGVKLVLFLMLNGYPKSR